MAITWSRISLTVMSRRRKTKMNFWVMLAKYLLSITIKLWTDRQLRERKSLIKNFQNTFLLNMVTGILAKIWKKKKCSWTSWPAKIPKDHNWSWHKYCFSVSLADSKKWQPSKTFLSNMATFGNRLLSWVNFYRWISSPCSHLF